MCVSLFPPALLGNCSDFTDLYRTNGHRRTLIGISVAVLRVTGSSLLYWEGKILVRFWTNVWQPSTDDDFSRIEQVSPGCISPFAVLVSLQKSQGLTNSEGKVLHFASGILFL